MKISSCLGLLVVPSLIALASGCSSTEAPSDGADSTERATASLRAGCQAYAEAMVQKGAECPLVIADRTTGEEVVERLARTCMSLFGAPGSGATEANLQACATATQAASCIAFHDGVEECKAPFLGTLAAEEECLFDTQCSSGVCMGSTGASCGRCKDRAGVGERCGNSAQDVPCEDDLVCLASSTTTGTCEPLADTSTKAEPGWSCETSCNNPWLVCANQKCVERGTVCRGSFWPEDCKAGQRCDAPSSSAPGTCVEGTFGGPGQPCQTATETGNYCNPGLYCESTSKTCRSRIAEGGGCAGDSTCAEGLTCLAGKCVVPEISEYSCGGAEQPKKDQSASGLPRGY